MWKIIEKYWIFIKNRSQNSLKILPKSSQKPSQNRPKTIPKSRKIRPWSQIDAKSHLVGTRSASGPPPRERRVTNFRLFGGKRDFRDRLLGPIKSVERSKIALLSQSGRSDPPKMTSEMRSGKNMKIRWKINAKMRGFWWPGTTFRIILFAYFTLSPFLKKVKKWMPKGMPKVILLDGKTVPGHHEFDQKQHFARFRKVQKKGDFSV